MIILKYNYTILFYRCINIFQFKTNMVFFTRNIPFSSNPLLDRESSTKISLEIPRDFTFEP